MLVRKQIERKFSEAARDLSDKERISAFNETLMDAGYLERDSGRILRAWEKRWLCAEYEAVDIVLHNPLAVHYSAVNKDVKGRIRLATDLRFVETGNHTTKDG